MKIPEASFKLRQALVKQLDLEFTSGWEALFREIAEYIMPRRYDWLGSATTIGGGKTPQKRNSKILNPAATIAARTTANGLMNGITSPARPWFRLRSTTVIPGQPNEAPQPHLVWFEECARRMHLVLSESNFYTAMGMIYLDLVVFGTGVMLCYEDFEDVVRFYVSPMGEYRIAQDARRVVNVFTRTISMTVQQVVQQFGLEACSPQTQADYKRGGPDLVKTIYVCHLVEENRQDDALRLNPRFRYRELYWERDNQTDGSLLALAGYADNPLIAPRWELMANDPYGTSPTLDALPDIKQLQFEVKQKSQGLHKQIAPPIVADVALRTNPTALLPNGISYVPSSSAVGAKPLLQLNLPMQDMNASIMELQERIGVIYYNHLFRNVSGLNTVRSAAEIYERKAEDMILLGPILERFENEALNPVIRRVFNIMLRKGLLPPPPPDLDVDTLDIQYISVLSDAQRAATTGSMERFAQVIGQLAAIAPDVLQIPDFIEFTREYASRLNVPAVVVKSRERVEQEQAARQELEQAQQAALVGSELTNAAKNLSQTDVGGGQNAIQALLGG